MFFSLVLDWVVSRIGTTSLFIEELVFCSLLGIICLTKRRARQQRVWYPTPLVVAICWLDHCLVQHYLLVVVNALIVNVLVAAYAPFVIGQAGTLVMLAALCLFRYTTRRQWPTATPVRRNVRPIALAVNKPYLYT
jgi:hypothetical protein